MSSRFAGIIGQSNANSSKWTPTLIPTRTTVYQNGVDGSALNTDVPMWPYAWSHSDPNGFRAAAASALAAAGQRDQVMWLWWQGEADTTDFSGPVPNTHYKDDLLELIADMDARTGRSDALWVIPRLNRAYYKLPDIWPGYTQDLTDAIRAQQEAAAAALPGRIALIDIDDLTLVDNAHYNATSYQELWRRARVAADAYWRTFEWRLPG